MAAKIVKTKSGTIIETPPLARLLFDDTRFSVVWLVVRVFIGLSWIDASLHKLSSPDWMVTGNALKGFWAKAVAVPDGGKAAAAYDWYRGFLQGMLDSGSYVWFAKLVAVGEFTIGLCLVLGMFVGIAALLGAFMNWNFIMAGSASTNGFMAMGAFLLVAAWKTAGWYGLDRILLPRLGTPWTRAKAAESETASQEPARVIA